MSRYRASDDAKTNEWIQPSRPEEFPRAVYPESPQREPREPPPACPAEPESEAPEPNLPPVLCVDELAILLRVNLISAFAREEGPEWYAAVCLAGEAGLRIGEVKALRWREDVASRS